MQFVKTNISVPLRTKSESLKKWDYAKAKLISLLLFYRHKADEKKRKKNLLRNRKVCIISRTLILRLVDSFRRLIAKHAEEEKKSRKNIEAQR